MIAAIEAMIAAGARGGIVPRAALAGCPVAATGICPLGPASRKPAASLLSIRAQGVCSSHVHACRLARERDTRRLPSQGPVVAAAAAGRSHVGV
jgi:hypothetical protein